MLYKDNAQAMACSLMPESDCLKMGTYHAFLGAQLQSDSPPLPGDCIKVCGCLETSQDCWDSAGAQGPASSFWHQASQAPYWADLRVVSCHPCKAGEVLHFRVQVSRRREQL